MSADECIQEASARYRTVQPSNGSNVIPIQNGSNVILRRARPGLQGLLELNDTHRAKGGPMLLGIGLP